MSGVCKDCERLTEEKESLLEEIGILKSDLLELSKENIALRQKIKEAIWSLK